MTTATATGEPRTLALVGTVELQAAAGGDGKKLPRVRVFAYSGGPMRVAGFYDPIVIDLTGAKFAAERLPLILDHDTGQRLGHTETQEITDKTIIASGVISAGSQAAADLVADAKNGFPFQASVGADIQELQRVREKETCTVNGRQHSGPLNVVRKCLVREISITVLGADSKTRVAIAAARARNQKGTKDMDETELEAGGSGTATLDAQVEMATAIDAICGSDWTGQQAEQVAVLRAQAIAGELAIRDLVAKVEKHKKLKALRAGRTQAPDLPGRHFTRDDHLSAVRGERTADGFQDEGRLVLQAAFFQHLGRETLGEKLLGAAAMQRGRDTGLRCLRDFCRAACELEGREAPRGDNELLRASFSTVSLPEILGDTLGKVAFEAYKAAPQTWRSFASIKSASDFREHTGLRLSDSGTMAEIGAAGEFHHGSLLETAYPFQVSTFGKILSLTRKDIINDDLSAFDDIPRLFAKTASRTLNDLVYRVLLANAGSHFASGNGNLAEAGSALASGSLGTALKMVRVQTDSNGAPLDLVPKILLVPPELEETAKGLLLSDYVQLASDATGPTGNIYRNALTLEVESRLSNSTFTGYSTTAWFVLCGPGDAPLIVSFLDGTEQPSIEFFGLSHDVNTLGVSWRIFHDFGAALGDPKAGVKCTGAAEEGE